MAIYKNETVIKVKDLRISFKAYGGMVRAVRGVSFDLKRGETMAIVGESGSGKSVTIKAIMGILAGNAVIDGGSIEYDGMDLTKASEEDFQKIRGNRIGLIFQDPLSALNPIIEDRPTDHRGAAAEQAHDRGRGQTARTRAHARRRYPGRRAPL